MTDTQTWLLIVTVTAILAWRCGMWWESKRPDREQRAREKQRRLVRQAAAQLRAEQTRGKVR